MKVNGIKHAKLPDRFDTAYGWGYGGRSQLYSVCLVDSYWPTHYLIGADSFEEAYTSAQECLSDTLEGTDLEEAETGDWLTWSESGRPISSDDDIRCTLVRDYDERFYR